MSLAIFLWRVRRIDRLVRRSSVPGAALQERVRLVAERLGVPVRSVRLVAGQTARRKLVEVAAPFEAGALEALLYQGARP